MVILKNIMTGSTRKGATDNDLKRYTLDTVASHSKSRPEMEKSYRARSASPDRATASLNLLRSCMKVQDALDENKT